MKENRVTITESYKITNAGTRAAIAFFGVFFIVEAIKAGSGANIIALAVIVTIALLAALTFFRLTENFILAFLIPFSLFALYTVQMVIGGWDSSFYLAACVCFSGICCMHSSLRVTFIYVLLQNIVIGAMIFLGIPVLGSNVSLVTVLAAWAFSLLGVLVLLAIIRYATTIKDKALDDQNSFTTLLSTTINYIALIDGSNHVVYVSKPLAQLARVERPELAKGRPLIDLFPGRDLKLLASKMLKQRENYSEDWQFLLDGHKHFFMVDSNTLGGTSGAALINLHDMTHLAELDEIAAMKDSLKIGLFFMDREFNIQDHYSRYLEEMLSEKDLFGKKFTSLLSASVSISELGSIRDYFGMIFERTFDQPTLDEINPLNELRYVSITTGDRKIFQCSFMAVERANGEVFILVSVYDITAKIELERRLLEEESRQQEEMRSIFELIQMDHEVFSDFMEDTEYEFSRIDSTLRDYNLTSQQVLVGVYQSIHAIKSNAVILGLNTFGDKMHEQETKIKELQKIEGDVPFDDMLTLTMDLERLSQEKEGFRAKIDRINSFKATVGEGKKQNEYVLVESLTKTANKVAGDLGKKVRFVVDGIDPEAIEKGPRRVMKEVLVQLVRNSVLHGIEEPSERRAKGKEETGVIRLSIKKENNNVHIRLSDDGKGLDFKKISKKAIQTKRIRPEDGSNKNILLKVIFSPGFSTSETESIHGGRGIGLNLVKDRVRDTKGTIKLQSESDKGTVFNFDFPI